MNEELYQQILIKETNITYSVVEFKNEESELSAFDEANFECCCGFLLKYLFNYKPFFSRSNSDSSLIEGVSNFSSKVSIFGSEDIESIDHSDETISSLNSWVSLKI